MASILIQESRSEGETDVCGSAAMHQLLIAVDVHRKRHDSDQIKHDIARLK